MTKAELETRLKMSDEALGMALRRFRNIRMHMQDMNFGTAARNCLNSIERIDEILQTNERLLRGESE